MNNGMKLLTISWLFWTPVAGASEQPPQNIVEYNGYSREDVKASLAVLIDSGTLSWPSNQCVKMDESLLKELRDEGLLKKDSPELSTICVDVLD